MDSFIILGLVPGTGIQITFEMWLQTAASLGLLFLFVRIYQIATYVVPLAPSRQPLHATQLHRRG